MATRQEQPARTLLALVFTTLAAGTAGVSFVIWYNDFIGPSVYPWRPPHPELSRFVSSAFVAGWLLGVPLLGATLIRLLRAGSLWPLLSLAPFYLAGGYALVFVVSMTNCAHNLGSFPLPVSC